MGIMQEFMTRLGIGVAMAMIIRNPIKDWVKLETVCL
jgi:hypothetical protein